MSTTDTNVTDINEARKGHAARQAVAAEDLVFEQTAYEEETREYLEQLGDDIKTMSPAAVRDGLLTRLARRADLLNMNHGGGKGRNLFATPKVIPSYCVPIVLMARYQWCAVDQTGRGAKGDAESHLLGVYLEDGPDEGIFESDAGMHRNLVRGLVGGDDRVIKSILGVIQDLVPVRPRTNEPHLFACANGVWDRCKKELLPFSPEYVFLSKSPIDYVAGAPMPVITGPDGEDWDVESWMSSLAPDDPEMVELLWTIVYACVFSGRRWDKSFWLVAPKGNNGKGTLLELIGGLLDPTAVSSIQIASFGKEYHLGDLLTASANIVDENDVGSFSERMGAWKAAITGDRILINRKYQNPVTIKWRGVDIQCFNESVPRVKDKSDSFLRRVMIIPFGQTFTGRERRYIKHDFIKRTEVLKYVLWRVLSMDVEELPEPAACVEAKANWQGGNDTRVDFWREHEDLFVWDLLPYGFLYEMFKAWMKKSNPSGRTYSKPEFTNWLDSYLEGSPRWEPKGRTAVRSSGKMNEPEHLIATYEMHSWYNQSYAPQADLEKRKDGKLPNLDRLCSPMLNTSYRGVRRLPGWTAAPMDEED